MCFDFYQVGKVRVNWGLGRACGRWVVISIKFNFIYQQIKKVSVNWGLGRACGDAWVTSCRPLSPPPTKGQRQPVRPTPILQYHSFSSKCKRQSKERGMASIKRTHSAISICIQSRYAKPCLKVLFGHTKSQSLKIVKFWRKKKHVCNYLSSS